VIIELDKLIWIKISWCEDGLDLDVALDKASLIDRPDN
jgi:hypothetical protein